MPPRALNSGSWGLAAPTSTRAVVTIICSLPTRPAYRRSSASLEELPPDVAVRVIALGHVSSARALSDGRSAEIEWLTSNSSEIDAREIVAAVDAYELGPDTFVWGAGEASVMRALRSHVRESRGLNSTHVEVRGYWRRGTAGSLGKDGS